MAIIIDDEVVNGFTFLRSYYETAKKLSNEQRLLFYDTIIAKELSGVLITQIVMEERSDGKG